MDIRRSTQIKSGDEVIGNRTRVKVVKNKVAPPFQKLNLISCMEKVFPKLEKLLNLAVEHDVVKKSGSWFSYGETKLGQGRDAVKELIGDNPELSDEIEAHLKEKMAAA